MSHLFAPGFIEHLAKALDLPIEAVQAAINTFCPETIKVLKQEIPPRSNSSNSSIPAPVELKKLTTTKSTTPKTTGKTTGKKTEHTCCRLKKGSVDPCGKPSKRSLMVDGEEKRYCGTEKSGCYKIMLAATQKYATKKADENFKTQTTKTDPVKVKTKVLDIINKGEKLVFTKTKLGDGYIYRNKDTNFVSNQETNKVIGRFDKALGKVVALKEEDYAELEKYSLNFEKPKDEASSSSEEKDKDDSTEEDPSEEESTSDSGSGSDESD